MLRALLIYLSEAAWARQIVTQWPVARRVALRFVAGEHLDEAIDAAHRLNEKGITATINILGESVTRPAHASRYTDAYCELLDAIEAARLRASVSVKLTALGLDIDPLLCRENMHTILTRSAAQGLWITIDMEDSSYTQSTLDMFRVLRDEDGFENLRAVIQSMLYRSEQDVQELVEEEAGLRLCKGAYNEPNDIAFPRKGDVDAAYMRQARILLNAAQLGRGYPGFATHDEQMIEAVKIFADERGVPNHSFEFQMLYGVRPGLQEQLIAEGYRVRVYVPYGEEWYPYFMRRLAERPANMWFFVSNFFRR
jgi:proline dehydrogenase